MSDQTQYQSAEDIRRSRDLSLEPQRPPSQIPGYRLQDFLGSGAYGEVWSATNEKTGRKVAVKFYTRRSKEDIQLLASEVQKLVVLAADRYVVQLLDVGWEAQPPYYVMDYIEHGSLEERLNKTEPMPAAVAIELFQEIANAMMHLHGRGILHCDLKPGNILLDQDGKPRVADFGQSRLSSDETAALGTLFYMAPEQADMNAAPDARWDVYGLGALLYSMLTGEPPYYSPEVAKEIESTHDIHERLKKYRDSIENANPPTAHRKVPGVDRMLAEIIDKCVAANAKNRFASVQSIIFALRQREVIRTRRPLMILGLLGPLLLLGVMSLFGWWAFRQAVGDTELEVSRKAVESNLFAARFAARSASQQIDEYFRAVQQLARDDEFLETFEAFDSDPDLAKIRERLSDTSRNNSKVKLAEFTRLREEFAEHSVRKTLQPFVDERMKNEFKDYPGAASWFVSDRWGNQVASAFSDGQVTSTLGMNWAYRTYFTGLAEDLKEENGRTEYHVPEGENDRKIITKPHICTIFISEASNTWKIAFSAPIFIKGKGIRGIVAATAELGDFVDFVDEDDQQYVILVDNRKIMKTQGTILQHPLFNELIAVKKVTSENGEVKEVSSKVPESLTKLRVNVESVRNNTIFFDPVGQTEQGTQYQAKAIAAVVDVEMKSLDPGSDEKDNSGLVVVAVENYDEIISSAGDLGQRLGRLGFLAAAFFVLVSVGMWLLVARMLRESRKKLDRTFSPASEASFLESFETVASPSFPGTEDHSR